VRLLVPADCAQVYLEMQTGWPLSTETTRFRWRTREGEPLFAVAVPLRVRYKSDGAKCPDDTPSGKRKARGPNPPDALRFDSSAPTIRYSIRYNYVTLTYFHGPRQAA
jgi:hypothetical protein